MRAVSGRQLARSNRVRGQRVVALGRFAVSQAHQGQKLGRILLMDALFRSFQNTAEVASAGVVAEAYNEAVRDFYLHHEFIPLTRWRTPRRSGGEYIRDGAARLQAYLRQFPDYTDAVVTTADLVVTGSNAVKATAAQRALIQDAGCPTRRDRHTSCAQAHLEANPQAPTLALFGVLETRKSGPLTFCRDVAPEG